MSNLDWDLNRAIIDATGAVMAAYGQQCAGRPVPELFWQRRDDGALFGQAGRHRYTAEQVPATLEPWAELLGLKREPDRGGGVLAYTGTVEGYPVRLWSVVDRNLWDRRTAELLAPNSKEQP